MQNLGDMLNQALKEASKSSHLKKQLKDAKAIIQQQEQMLATKEDELISAQQQVHPSSCIFAVIAFNCLLDILSDRRKRPVCAATALELLTSNDIHDKDTGCFFFSYFFTPACIPFAALL